MRIEFLYIEGCPGYEPTLERLRSAMSELGIDEPVEMIRVESAEQARQLRFLGSPSIRIDGLDVEREARVKDNYGLTCRVYRTDSGFEGAVPLDMIRSALVEAAKAGAASGSTCCSCCGGGASGADIKEAVKENYGRAAAAAASGKQAGCCGETGKDAITRDLYAEAETQGIPVKALLASLGCANPTALAELKPGEVVLDLGSGGGIDVLLSAKRVGPTGRAYGLDMTDEMLELARRNQKEAGVENAEFLKGDIENIPLPDCSVDVIISNCVINLSTDKDRVLREAFRVLKPGGRFAVADIVLTRTVSETVRRHIGLWTGCIAGALEIEEYKKKLEQAGFESPQVEVVRTYGREDAEGLVPPEAAAELGEDGTAELMSSFVSAFIRAVKPSRTCCCG